MEENKNQDLEEIKKAINKQSNTNIVVMTLLIILVLALTAIIINDKFLSDDNKEEAAPAPIAVPSGTPAPTTTSRVELKENDATVKKIMDIFIPTGEVTWPYDWNFVDLNTSSSYRLNLVYNNLSKSDIKKTVCTNYPTEIENGLCGDATSDQSYVGLSDEQKKNYSTSVISEEAVKAKYKELFGTNYEYKAETIITEHCVNFYHYNVDTKEYVMYAYGSGCTAMGIKNKFVSAYKEDNKLIIKTEYENIGAKTKATLTYEFKLEDGNYTFVKVTEE